MAAQMQHVAAFSLVAAPLLPTAGKGPKRLKPWLRGPMKSHFLTLLPPSTANASPGGSGPGALPGLPAPMGVNGFGSLTPQTNGQPGSDTLYNNGLSPYPGGSPYPADSNLEMEWKRGISGKVLLGGKGFPHLPCCLSQRSSTSHTPTQGLSPGP